MSAAETIALRSQSALGLPEARMAPATFCASSVLNRTENISPKALFFGRRGLPIFLVIKQTFRLQQVLDEILVYVYIKSSLEKISRLPPFPEECPHVSGKVSDQRHPAVTGAGNERLAMKIDSFQAPKPDRQNRSLQIEAVGDFARGEIKPRIRLHGNWLERAGFKPGHRVEVRLDRPGTMTLSFLELAKEVSL